MVIVMDEYDRCPVCDDWGSVVCNEIYRSTTVVEYECSECPTVWNVFLKATLVTWEVDGDVKMRYFNEG
jgi:hypothetical protein